MIEKIISGGQTGADRAGTDVAIELGYDWGGYLTKGRRSEDGIVPLTYTKFVELDTSDYPTRTERNMVESDATVLITIQGLTGGSLLTKNLAAKHKKPCCHLNMDEMGVHVAAEKLEEWLKANPGIKVLNVAGSRESKEKGFGEKVKRVLRKALPKKT